MFNREFQFVANERLHGYATLRFVYKIRSEDEATATVREIRYVIILQDHIRISLSIILANNDHGMKLNEYICENFNIYVKSTTTNNLIFAERKFAKYNSVKLITEYLDIFSSSINFIHSHRVIDDAAHDMLHADLSFPFLREQVTAMLVDVAAENIAEAIKKAFEWKAYGCTNAIFDLAEHFKSINKHQEAADLYSDIPPWHENYMAAQNSLKEIILMLLQAHQDKQVALTADDVKYYKEHLLRCSLNMEDKAYSTQLFFELSGMPMRVDYPEITPNTESLIMIANEISKLSSKIVELEHKMQKSKLAKFKIFDNTKSDESMAIAPAEEASSTTKTPVALKVDSHSTSLVLTAGKGD